MNENIVKFSNWKNANECIQCYRVTQHLLISTERVYGLCNLSYISIKNCCCFSSFDSPVIVCAWCITTIGMIQMPRTFSHGSFDRQQQTNPIGAGRRVGGWSLTGGSKLDEESSFKFVRKAICVTRYAKQEQKYPKKMERNRTKIILWPPHHSNDRYRFVTKWQSIYGRITNQCLFVNAFSMCRAVPYRSLCFLLMFVLALWLRNRKIGKMEKKKKKISVLVLYTVI